MHCYSLTEQVMTGIVITRASDGYPHISTPEGCPFVLLLDKQLTDVVERIPPAIEVTLADGRTVTQSTAGPLWLDHADVGFEHGVFVLKTARVPGPGQALVRIETAGGDGGRVFLTGNAYDERFIKGRVKWCYRPFPPTGVNPLVESTFLERLRFEGAEMLDLFVIMSPGASFRIWRTGRLEGASPTLVVQWTGRTLHCRPTGGYDARGPVAFATAGAAS